MGIFAKIPAKTSAAAAMGIDLVADGRSKKTKCTSPRSDDVYLKLLVKLYKYLVRRTGINFNAVILKRLFMSKTNKLPLSLKRLMTFMKGKDDKIAVIVGTVTDDKRVVEEIPTMKVTALRFTETARARIVKAGGECLMFDQLAMLAPLGQNTIEKDGHLEFLEKSQKGFNPYDESRSIDVQMLSRVLEGKLKVCHCLFDDTLKGPNNAKEKPENNQAKSHLTRSLNGSNTLHADSNSEIPCSTADGMECAPTVCLDKEFSDVAPVVEELRPSKKTKDQADEELCCNETDAGIYRMETDFEELNAQDGLEENTIDSSYLSESELILKPHIRERKLIDFRGKLYLAPLTTVGNLPFRRICKVLGADITCGEMAMCTNLLQGQASEWALLRRHSSEDLFGVQICGAYPDTITRTAELIDQECTVDFIDINMGCPIDIVVNKGAGSSLLTKPMRIKNIAQAASSTISKPITLKVRTGYFEGRNRIDSLISDISHWGVSALTVHGRSRQQRYSKLADWDYIYQCAKKSPDVMQILGNGDIFSYVDWNKHTSECPELSSCMIARGALIKPWLFTEIKEQRHWDISSCERLNIFKDYVNFGLEHWGSDTKGVETTRHFLLEWLSYTHRYVPVGLLEVIPQRINWRSPGYVGRDDLETLMASDSAADWVRISELLLGKVPEGFTFAPKHKSNAYDRTENG